MADEPNVAPDIQDTPNPEAPVTPDTPTPESPEIDYQQRYEALRPEFDQRNQFIAAVEGRQGPEAQEQALRQIGIDLQSDDPEPVDSSDDFFDVPDPSAEIAQLRRELAEDKAQAAQAQEHQAEAEYVEQTVAQLEQKDNLNLTDDEYNYVVNYGLTHRDEFDGRPDLEGGLAALKAVQQAGQQRYLKSKETAALAPTGSTGEPNINFRDKE
ncbi:MAG: hypothetical protein JST59_15715, partial [Actinobacteria bacterium]|nr:hypothetical protein [Actinomycetota bacterium]